MPHDDEDDNENEDMENPDERLHCECNRIALQNQGCDSDILNHVKPDKRMPEYKKTPSCQIPKMKEWAAEGIVRTTTNCKT